MDNRPMASAVVIFAAMALIALIDNMVVTIAQTAGLGQFHLIRSLVALPVLLGAAHLAGVRIRPRNWRPVAARALAVAVSMLLYFGALGLMPVAQAAAGLFTAPLWVVLISALILRERIGPRRLAAVAIGFTGALIVLDPGSGGLGVAITLPIAGGLFYGIGAIATRRWCAQETAVTLLCGFYVAMTVLSAVGAGLLGLAGQPADPGPSGFILRAWGPVDMPLVGLICVQAVGSVTGVYMLTRGYQLAEASYASVFEYSFLVFAAFWGALLFGQSPGPWELMGIGLILASGALVAFSRSAPTRAQTR